MVVEGGVDGLPELEIVVGFENLLPAVGNGVATEDTAVTSVADCLHLVEPAERAGRGGFAGEHREQRRAVGANLQGASGGDLAVLRGQRTGGRGG